MNKKMILTVGLAVFATSLFAGPHRGGRGPVGRHHVAPRHHHHHHHHHHSTWGRGGRHFWPGFAGGVVGGIIGRTLTCPSTTVVTTPTVVSAPTVVTTPVVVTPQPVATVQSVWVEGRYVDQVQPNGTLLRVWQPGHYEQRTLVVP